MAAIFEGPGLETPGGISAFPPSAPPAAVDPREIFARVGGVGAPRAGWMGRGQQLPAFPALQGACVINDFDPAWGVPPDHFGNLPLRFDPEIGAYRLEPGYVRERVHLEKDPVARRLFEQYRLKWGIEKLMLQPYKQPGDARWHFRWIPRMRGIRCPSGTSAPPSYRTEPIP